MGTVIVTLIFIGSYFLYSTSKYTSISSCLVFNVWILENRKRSNYIGVLTLIISLIGSMYSFGLTAGGLYWLITLSTIMGLIIIIVPLNVFSYKHTVSMFTILLFIELTL